MNELAKVNPSALIDRMQGQFAKVLPKILPPERFCRVVLSAINKSPALLEAISDKQNQPSVLSAFMRCAEMGLEPDGRRAVINCYRKRTGGYDLTLIPMYQGLSELAMRSGVVSNIHADKVCENDEFEWNTGEIKHIANFRKPRGAAYAYYCKVTFKDGSVKTETMSKLEVEEIMKRSSAYQGASKYGKSCPWMTDFDEMAKKTVFRRCAKWLPLSPELRLEKAFEADNSDYAESAAEIKHAVNDKFAQDAGINEEAQETTIDADIVDESSSASSVSSDSGEHRNDNLFGENK